MHISLKLERNIYEIMNNEMNEPTDVKNIKCYMIFHQSAPRKHTNYACKTIYASRAHRKK